MNYELNHVECDIHKWIRNIRRVAAEHFVTND